MSTTRTSRDRAVFGDFQTPLELTRSVVNLVHSEHPDIAAVVEPTCGLGAFLRAAIESFGGDKRYFAFDINADYLKQAGQTVSLLAPESVEIGCQDFYEKDWKGFFGSLPSPVLVVGNPPWVTNAALGVMGGANLPTKSNFQRHSGFAAKTGKANFDISEWMLIKLLEALQGMPAILAMLCKTSTARKVLRHAWKEGLEIGPSSLHLIDAAQHFGVSVDACLLLTHSGNGKVEATATTYSDLRFAHPLRTFGLFAGDLVSDMDAYRELRDIEGLEYRKWRSGVKHDAAAVMEFTRKGSCCVNGLGEKCNIEDDYLYPLLKSSDLANGRLVPSKYVLLSQRRMSDDTAQVEFLAPKTWQYLLAHAEQLDHRRSSIYANRPRFAVFGIGDYTFSSWKVAISGLYKNVVFRVVGQHAGKPIVLDDTCYFLPCETEQEATFLCDLLNSRIAGRFIASLVFPDSKRPVTIDVLKRIDLMRVGERLDRARETLNYLAPLAVESSHQRLLVFEEREEYRTATNSTCPAATR